MTGSVNPRSVVLVSETTTKERTMATTTMTTLDDGVSVPVTILESDGDGAFLVELVYNGRTYRLMCSSGDLFTVDESGRYLGGVE